MIEPNTVHQGDCLEVMREWPDNFIDSTITDPPYGLSSPPDIAEVLRHWLNGDDYKHRGGGFMGKSWDSFVPDPSIWREVYRVMKPGATLLCFAGARTVDLMGISLRLAGFELRDTIFWCYGSGFPKSLDIGKSLDKSAGIEREIVGKHPQPARNKKHETVFSDGNYEWRKPDGLPITAPATDAAKLWDGWGTGLKPSVEPILLCQKPIEGTYAENAQKWGVAGLWIDGGRIETNGDKLGGGGPSSWIHCHEGYKRPFHNDKERLKALDILNSEKVKKSERLGRFPANLILDDSVEVRAGFPISEVSGQAKSGKSATGNNYDKNNMLFNGFPSTQGALHNDSGTAARFFYCAKASQKERQFTRHPTQKPLALMRYLCRLTKTPTGGIVLDPFAGSGTTLEAAYLEGRPYIGVEKDTTYYQDILERLAHVRCEPYERPEPEKKDAARQLKLW